MEQKTIGSFIAVLRKANGMTQKQLAEKLCVSDKTVSRWECNETTPDLSLIPVIAEIFNITSDELLRGERKQRTTEIPRSEGRSEKQLQYILQSIKARHSTRMLITSLIALIGWIIAVGCTWGSVDAAALISGLVFSLTGIVFQITGTIQLSFSIHSEEFNTPQVISIKRWLIDSTLFLCSVLVVFTCFTLPGIVLYDVVEGLIIGGILFVVSAVICFGLSIGIKGILSSHGHKYLKD